MLLKELEVGYENLYLLIEKKRKEMFDVANKKGLISIETIRCSEELDTLINLYQTQINNA